MAARFALTVEYDDGATLQVTANQRDIVNFERDEKMSAAAAGDMMPIALFWCLAYYAMRRTGVISADTTRAVWEATVVDVSLAATEPVDPTRPAAPAGSRSKSPTRQASRTRKS